MPVQVAPWVPMALGSAAARAAGGLYRWSDSHYINPRPVGPAAAPATRMAKRARSYTRTTKKRRFKRRRMRRPAKRITNLWPPTQLVKFRQVMAYSSSPAAGAGLTLHNYKANSLDDPFGGGGNQLPLGLDQWAAMYKKYVVVSSQCFVKIHNTSSTGSVTFGLTLRNPGETATLGSAEAYLETPMTVSKLLSPDLDHAALGMSYRAKRYWHVRKFMDHDELHGDFGTAPSSPNKSCYVTFWHQDTNNSDAYTLEGYVTFEYVCLLFERVTPSRSSM